jgi:hypothetical protein
MVTTYAGRALGYYWLYIDYQQTCPSMIENRLGTGHTEGRALHLDVITSRVINSPAIVDDIGNPTRYKTLILIRYVCVHICIIAAHSTSEGRKHEDEDYSSHLEYYSGFRA